MKNLEAQLRDANAELTAARAVFADARLHKDQATAKVKALAATINESRALRRERHAKYAADSKNTKTILAERKARLKKQKEDTRAAKKA